MNADHSYTRPVADPVDSATERIGILSGTFDPVHVGHIVVAVDTRVALGLDRVLLVIAGDPWQKRGRVVATAEQRLMLAAAAVEDLDGVEVSAVEVERSGASVTADTLEVFAGPHRDLFLILGADAVANMGTWRRLDETRGLATIVVVERTGDAHATPPGPGWRVERVTIPRVDVSSTDIRERLAGGRPIDGLVPPAVVHAIAAHGLYTRPR